MGFDYTVSIGSFSWALMALKDGERVYRSGWNGKDMWIKIERPEGGDAMTSPYIYMKTADDKFVPWLASQSDLMDEDWEVVVKCRNCGK